MPEPRDHLLESAGAEYMVALLALWAGDDRSADALLRGVSAPAWAPVRHRGRQEVFWEDPLATSAVRARDQLRRRKKLYRMLHKAAGTDEPTEMNVLTSTGKHLAGVIWSESNRDYEFRVYVNDLRWEHVFYATTYGRANVGVPNPELHPLPYVTEPDVEPHEYGALDQAWTESGDMFMQIFVTDFCTMIVRAIWTKPTPPEDAAELVKPFQALLDSLDPRV